MVSQVAAKRFAVVLERVGKTATMFRVPFDLKEAFGRARPPVLVTIKGHTWRTTPGVYDCVGHIVVNRSVKAATGVDAGDRVTITMELGTKPRTVKVPADLEGALAADPAARAAFDKLSFTHRREYVEWIAEAKRPETRARRVAGTVERVREGAALR
jgi:ribosomal 50S subunit-recycling heat shock protein